jgi:hypothetical protein
LDSHWPFICSEPVTNKKLTASNNKLLEKVIFLFVVATSSLISNMSSFCPCSPADEADIDKDGLIDYAEFFGMMTPGGKI